ncbi:MAG: NTP transferase domain-containing protein [Candidatus Delongbacteria bacterium]|nr:NTP transferase domain-containing protein [Candidatus Delongbacteria bacterium]
MNQATGRRTLTQELSVIILAAGKGTRMKSDLAKVLHPALGRPMIDWVIDQARAAGSCRTVVVVGHQREAVIDAVSARGVEFAVQAEQKGTGHAVQMCAPSFGSARGDVLVLSGDVPLLRGETLADLLREHRAAGRQATVLTALFDDPTGYGRVIRDADGAVRRIVEHKDASDGERAVKEINSGIYVFDISLLFQYIKKLDSNNSQGELYLTDVVRFLVEDGHSVGAVIAADPNEINGVNTVDQLAEVETLLRARR